MAGEDVLLDKKDNSRGDPCCMGLLSTSSFGDNDDYYENDQRWRDDNGDAY